MPNTASQPLHVRMRLHSLQSFMGAETKELRNQTAIELFNYGYSVSNLYMDANQDALEPVPVEGGVEDTVSIYMMNPFGIWILMAMI